MATVSSWYYVRGKSSNMSEQYYTESLDQAASYNARLAAERRLRLPFLDQQTGLAQNHSNLWMPFRYRLPGKNVGQLYSYPAKRWKKKKRSVPLSDLKATRVGDVETGDSDSHQISAVENPALKTDTDSKDTIINEEAVVKEKWFMDDFEALSEPPDAGEIDEMNSDSSDFGEIYERKRKKKPKAKGSGRKGRGGGRGRKSDRDKHKEEPVDEKEKPYACDTCGARYKTRPGLTYHLTHFHNQWDDEEEASAPSPKHTPQSSQNNDPITRSTWSSNKSGGTNTKAANGKANPNNYCDFCLGDEKENKKTGDKEELVSCADCGRSGHPSCLQFTANMIISVKKYPWQCIECKSCGLCGTSDNDEQLLFCDDCDRGYHMYCLKPPLSEPPEGSWSCHLCIEEFYGGKKPESMQ